MRIAWRVAALAVVGVAVVIVAGFGVRGQETTKGLTAALSTPYQAILLTNGQAYFGKLEQAGTAFPVLTDVYYVQTRVNPETKETSNVLVKRGIEWHAPDRMILNMAHIILIEPVAQDSTLAKLIKEAKDKKPQEGITTKKAQPSPAEKAAPKAAPR